MPSHLPHFVPQGVSTHFVVKGDHVAEVVLCVRPRRIDAELAVDLSTLPPDPDHLTTPFVAEITGGDNLEAVGLHVGLVVEVKAQGVVVASRQDVN